MANPGAYLKLPDGPTSFEYIVKNFQLGTTGSSALACSNCPDRSGILVFINNELPHFSAKPEFKKDIPEGHHLSLSVLCRADGTTLKQYGSYDLRQFTMGGAKEQDLDITEPMLFYNLPRGNYLSDGERGVILDFYLANTSLSDDGYRIKVTLDDTEIIISEWSPYLITGLKTGSHQVKLELLDENDTSIQILEQEFRLLVPAT